MVAALLALSTQRVQQVQQVHLELPAQRTAAGWARPVQLVAAASKTVALRIAVLKTVALRVLPELPEQLAARGR